MEEGAVIAPDHNPLLHPQIQPSADGSEVTCHCGPCCHPQIHASEEGAGVTRPRSRDTSPAAPESLPFNDDMLREILIRLPPQPSSLPRASAVCKRWLGLITDPKFKRQFRAHHQNPPLLGAFWQSLVGIMFDTILEPPNRIPPHHFDLGHKGFCALLDCHQGRLLVEDKVQNGLVVYDPITGEQHCFTIPSELQRGYLEGAVVCASGDRGHVHVGCHFSSLKVVLVSTTRSDKQCLDRVYSLETGVWGNLTSTETPYEPFYADNVPATIVGNCLYWSTGVHILEFDLDRQNLAVIMGPPITNGISHGSQIIQAADGDVGYAILLYPRLEMWQRNINAHGVATWVLWKTFEMHTILLLPTPHEEVHVHLLGYDEDDVVFLSYYGSVYMVQLKLMQSKKLNEIYSTGNRYFPFKSFFTPGRTIAGGFNGAEMLNIG